MLFVVQNFQFFKQFSDLFKNRTKKIDVMFNTQQIDIVVFFVIFRSNPLQTRFASLTSSNLRFDSSRLVHHPPVSETRPPIYPTRHSVGLDTLAIVACVPVARHIIWGYSVPPIHSAKSIIQSAPHLPDAMRCRHCTGCTTRHSHCLLTHL